jgi:hypothetical protein
VQESAAIAPALALALAEPADAQHPLVVEGTPTARLPARYCRRKTTSDATVFPSRDARAMPLLPFMHNVLAKRRAGGASA